MKIPRRIKPMLATLVDKPFDKPGWIFETKWDGFRAIAEITHGKATLYSRNLHEFKQFPSINQALGRIKHTAVLDGEVVATDGRGHTHFQLLQNYQRTGKGQIVYNVFDLLYLDGKNLRKLPLKVRRATLKRILPQNNHVHFSIGTETYGKSLFAKAKKLSWEGIIAKDGNAPYLSGKRTRSWLKIKTHLRQEVVIAGFTKPEGTRKYFGALILGVYEKDKLVFVGHAGTGFDVGTLKLLHNKLKPLVQKASPLNPVPKNQLGTYWVKPKLVCEVSFAEWTKEGLMRQAVFVGLRTDKNPKQIKRELPI